MHPFATQGRKIVYKQEKVIFWVRTQDGAVRRIETAFRRRSNVQCSCVVKVMVPVDSGRQFLLQEIVQDLIQSQPVDFGTPVVGTNAPVKEQYVERRRESKALPNIITYSHFVIL